MTEYNVSFYRFDGEMTKTEYVCKATDEKHVVNLFYTQIIKQGADVSNFKISNIEKV